MAYPTSYDDDSILLGDLQDQKSVVLHYPCANVDTELFFESVVGIAVPTYISLGDELIYATASNTGLASLTVVRAANATSHLVGEAAFIVLTGEHLTRIRDRAIITQQYQGLTGLDGAKPVSPAVAEVYIATDTNKVYVCVVAGTWSLLGGATSHADVQREGETDDHLQYFQLARLTAWHTGLGGEHVTDGDSHDHRYGGAGRLATALSGALPNKSVGQIRLATNTAEIFMAISGSAWVAATGAPSGTIAMFMEADVALYGSACPSGWTRYVALDGRFPKGAPSGVTTPLLSGGSLTHVHSYSQVPAHVHQIPKLDANSGSAGDHSHSFPFSTLASGSGMASQIVGPSNGATMTTSASGSHTHTFNYPLTNTGASAGAGSASTGAGDSQPPFLEVVFCKKD